MTRDAMLEQLTAARGTLTSRQASLVAERARLEECKRRGWSAFAIHSEGNVRHFQDQVDYWQRQVDTLESNLAAEALARAASGTDGER
jgi:hypothetical protein